MPINTGSFAPINVVAPPGTIADPVFPVQSVAGNSEGQRPIIACISRALAKPVTISSSAASA